MTSSRPATRRRPRVDPLVPTRDVDWLLGRVHVATPAAEVTATIEALMGARTDPRWTPAIRRQTVRYALWRHAANYRQYADVMRGRP